MAKEYGKEKGEEVFYATANKEGWNVKGKRSLEEIWKTDHSRFERAASDEGYPWAEIDDFVREKLKVYPQQKAGDWDYRYGTFSPEKKKRVDEYAQDMFHQNFLQLDTDDQNRVIKALSTAYMMEEKSVRMRTSDFSVEMKNGLVTGTSGVLIDSKPDLYDDICTKYCLKDMVDQIRERKITMDLEHETFRRDPSGLSKTMVPISRIDQANFGIGEDGHGFVQIKDTMNQHNSRYPEIAGSIKDGYLTAYSIAFRPEKVSYKSIGGKRYRILDKVNLLNVTYTGVPVNPRAQIGEIQMKSLSSIDNQLLLRIVNGDDVDAKSVEGSVSIEAKSKDGVSMAEKNEMVEKKDETPPASDSQPAQPNPPAAGDTLEGILKEILARLAALETKFADLSNSTKAAEPEEKKEEEPKEEKKEETQEKALEIEVANLKAKNAELEKVLNTPHVKGMRSHMEAETKAQEEKTQQKADLLRMF